MRKRKKKSETTNTGSGSDPSYADDLKLYLAAERRWDDRVANYLDQLTVDAEQFSAIASQFLANLWK